MARFGKKVKISKSGNPPVYLSIFSKDDGRRLTSYTTIGAVHGKTMEDLESKAAESYPDDYHIQQTDEEWAATIASDLRWNGETYTEPPEPTPEELADQQAAQEAGTARQTLDGLTEKAMRNSLAGGGIATLSLSYQQTLSAVSDAAALKMPEYFPAWDGDSHAYSVGDRVTYGDTLYKCLQAHTSQATWTPTDAPSLWAKVLITGTETTPPEWEQPGSTNPYMTGDRVTYGGKVYESTIDNNVWKPDEYPQGWKEVNE